MSRTVGRSSGAVYGKTVALRARVDNGGKNTEVFVDSNFPGLESNSRPGRGRSAVSRCADPRVREAR
jgi:hypothetical protein